MNLARPTALLAACIFAASALAIMPIPSNLGNGLSKLVENNLLIEGGAARYFNGFATEEAASVAKHAIANDLTSSYLVEVMPDGSVPVTTLETTLLTQFPFFIVRAVDNSYCGHGIIEGFARIDDISNMARLAGVRSIFLELQPHHNAGAVTSQGVNYHRINRINQGYNSSATTNYTGTGMSVGVLSDSFDASSATTDRAATDTSADELPSVVVLEDLPYGQTGTDEGRAMCQIVHDIAPAARIAFATADVGETDFANNIRALAALNGYAKSASVQQGFKADTICDDILYLDEPMFSDGLITQAVNDVVAAGVTYASSAGNNGGVDGYASVFRPVANGSGLTAATNSALAGTNINLSGVNTKLYAGGFHNFNPKAGSQDIAQTINTGADVSFVFQWNDPFDVPAPVVQRPAIYTNTGTSTAGSSVDFLPPTFVANHAYVITEVASTTTPPNTFDGIVTIFDPSGNKVVDQDESVDETVIFFAPVSGQYTIRVRPASTTDQTGATTPTQGPFTLRVYNASGMPAITQDFNVLFFDMNGHFLTALGENNFANNRPIELFTPTFHASGYSQVQLVISRTNPVAPANAATQLKYLFFGDGVAQVGPAEYGSPLTPVTFGHSAAAGANSVAAYEVFRPNLPEDFTSPGPVTIYFDTNNNRLATPIVREKPDLAAADGVNNSFFPSLTGGDVAFDPDSSPNFYGTSAAAPHCAAIAALLLQAHGGTGSLSPTLVRQNLRSSAFPHDLDPYFVSGSASLPNGAQVVINVASDNSRNTGTGANDPNSWSVRYSGPGQLVTLNFNPEGTSLTGGNPTGGNFNGSTPADFLNSAKYKFTPGMVFTSTFLFGDSVGLTSADVVYTRSNPAGFPSNLTRGNPMQHEWTLNLAFPTANFTDGKVLRFNVGRAQQQDASVPQGVTSTSEVRKGDYSADILGSGVFIPEDPNGTSIGLGMTFNGTVADGANVYNFSGRLTNNIGRGYSPLDGYGFINAEAAITGSSSTLPIGTPTPAPTPFPTATPTATIATPTPTPIPTPTPFTTPTPVPTPTAVRLVNISGRLLTQTDDNVGIAGFIVQGIGLKRLIVRGLGPSLSANGQPIPGTLQNPVLELHASDGSIIAMNDNWRDSQELEIEQSGLQPSDDRESTIIATLPAGSYTTILRGVNNTTGISLIEVYDLDSLGIDQLGNLSVRANVGADDNVLINGVILSGGTTTQILFRGIGPSLTANGAPVPTRLLDPVLEVHDGNGMLLQANDNWRDAPNASDIQATGLQPNDDHEAAVLLSLPPGSYTSIVAGANRTTGIGLAEVYDLSN